MNESKICNNWEDITWDLYSLAQIHSMEIHKLQEEFEDKWMLFMIELETYEKERVQWAKGNKEEDETKQIDLSDDE